MKMRFFIRLPQLRVKVRVADLTRLWRAKARASASRFLNPESTPTTVIATSTCAAKSKFVNRLVNNTCNRVERIFLKERTNEKQNCAIYRWFGPGSRRRDGLLRDAFSRLHAEPFDAWFHDGQ